jgi:hypothetical protein
VTTPRRRLFIQSILDACDKDEIQPMVDGAPVMVEVDMTGEQPTIDVLKRPDAQLLYGMRVVEPSAADRVMNAVKNPGNVNPDRKRKPAPKV